MSITLPELIVFISSIIIISIIGILIYRNISLNNVEQILYRVINISKDVIGNVDDNNYKEFSQWGIYNL